MDYIHLCALPYPTNLFFVIKATVYRPPVAAGAGMDALWQQQPMRFGRYDLWRPRTFCRGAWCTELVQSIVVVSNGAAKAGQRYRINSGVSVGRNHGLPSTCVRTKLTATATAEALSATTTTNCCFRSCSGSLLTARCKVQRQRLLYQHDSVAVGAVAVDALLTLLAECYVQYQLYCSRI